jgi:hypothetical protein
MKQHDLNNPFPNGSKSEGYGVEHQHPDGLAYLEMFERMEMLRQAGEPIYIEIVAGDRKGSIAKYVTDNPIETNTRNFDRGSFRNKDWYWGYYVKTTGHLIWDGRKNKIQCPLQWGREYEWLEDYEGETVYKMFDKKKAKDDLIKNAKPLDMDGNVLKIGDNVLYVNLRYGDGAQLTRGTIVGFDGSIAERNTRYAGDDVVYTLVHDNDGEESKIRKSKQLILKVS